MSDFDVIVIGTGVTGQTVAEELARGGRRVAIVDRREYGGTCTLRGCEPKKVLVTAAEVVERAEAQAGNGPAGDVRLDWPALIAFKRTFTDSAPQEHRGHLKSAGVETLHGQARFTGPESLAVDGARTRPSTSSSPPERGRCPWASRARSSCSTSEDFMAPRQLGERIVFIGGGYISMEFAHVAAAAGAAVTICHRGARVLGGFDPDLAGMLVDGYKRAGIEVRTKAPVQAVVKEAGALAVVLEDGTRLPADMVVHGAGRVPDLEALDLGRSGRDLRHAAASMSTRRCAASPTRGCGQPGTPRTADCRSRRSALSKGASWRRTSSGLRRPTIPPSTPSVVFSDPPLATVGLTEAQAAEQGLDVRASLIDRTAVGVFAPGRRPGRGRQGARRAGDADASSAPTCSGSTPRRSSTSSRPRWSRGLTADRSEGDAVGVSHGRVGDRVPRLSAGLGHDHAWSKRATWRPPRAREPSGVQDATRSRRTDLRVQARGGLQERMSR